ncbi:MAG: hypothetical protein AAFW70_00870 [Cyanobacteria bacterium J06635_10]
MNKFKAIIDKVSHEADEELKTLRELEVFVLDNSVRETTVGTARGHVLEDKINILKAIAETELNEVILGTYGANRNVDDQIPKHWIDLGGTLDNMWGFSEAYNALDQSGVPIDEPASGLLEMANDHKMSNAIIEIDLCSPAINYQQFSLNQFILNQVEWANKNLIPRGEQKLPPRVLVNLRDFANFETDTEGLIRCLHLIESLGNLPSNQRPFGLMIEEPTGFLLPETVSKLTRIIRETMISANWSNGKLLVHVHCGFGLAESTTLEALANGADGIWSAVCKAGAALGHSCSSITLTNLARLGNKFVTRTYKLPAIIKAARKVHTIASKEPVPRDQEVYGKEAFDLVFGGWHGFMGDKMSAVASIIGVKQTVRISDFANAEMLHQAMIERFGEPEKTGWDEKLCKKMEEKIDEHLLLGQSFDYNTITGLAQLYEYSGGCISSSMLQIITSDSDIPNEHPLIVSLKQRWKKLSEKFNSPSHKNLEELISIPSIFWQNPEIPETMEEIPVNYFLDDIFRGFHVTEKQREMISNLLDVDGNGYASWQEFVFRLKWTIQQKGLLYYSTPEALILGTFEFILQDFS